MPGILSGGGLNVGWTVSRQIRHVLGGQIFADFGAGVEVLNEADLGGEFSFEVEPSIRESKRPGNLSCILELFMSTFGHLVWRIGFALER